MTLSRTPGTPTRTYREFTALKPFAARARDIVRAAALRLLSLRSNLGTVGNELRFPFYHHVFVDERIGFTAQIDLLRNQGEFISMDDALGLLGGGTPLDGRYFCLSFDDGLKSCFSDAFPILAERQIPAIFYLVSDLVGQSLVANDPVARQVFGFKGASTTLDFLSWDECREMAANGMSFGSHTSTHIHLLSSDTETAHREMQDSKITIEQEVGACEHFCPPYGIPGVHYDPVRDPDLARSCGYRSFATGVRGGNPAGADPFSLRRDQLLANWGTYQIRYFLARG